MQTYLVGTVDPMLAGITNEAIHILNPTINITPTANYFFMVASTFLITILGTIFAVKVVEPRLESMKVELMLIV